MNLTFIEIFLKHFFDWEDQTKPSKKEVVNLTSLLTSKDLNCRKLAFVILKIDIIPTKNQHKQLKDFLEEGRLKSIQNFKKEIEKNFTFLKKFKIFCGSYYYSIHYSWKYKEEKYGFVFSDEELNNIPFLIQSDFLLVLKKSDKKCLFTKITVNGDVEKNPEIKNMKPVIDYLLEYNQIDSVEMSPYYENFWKITSAIDGLIPKPETKLL